MTRSKARQTFLFLETPNLSSSNSEIDRDIWIEETCKEFVSKSTANKLYYRAVLEELWPSGHGIPGPIVHQSKIRDAINKVREQLGQPPYLDPFRRVRELQGEEGIIGITRQGNSIQLVNLTTAPKRIPRVSLNNIEWKSVLVKYGFACPVCGRKEPEIRFDQDHKIPRVRGGSNSIENWQPLCHECNNFKSTSCRGCNLDCQTCSWAYPEKYSQIKMSQSNIKFLREKANEMRKNPSDLLNEIIEKYNKTTI